MGLTLVFFFMTSSSSLWRTQQPLQKGRLEIITSMAVTNSLKVGAVIKQITIFYEPINTNLQRKRSKFFLSPNTSQKFGFTYFQSKTLTSPSEGLWLANPSLLWLSYLLFQDSLTTFRSTTPEIFSPLISEELSGSNLFIYYFNFVICVLKKWTDQDGIPSREIKVW